ncbi:MAG: hypothetical protein KJO38_12285 [Gammaproteobacteria bacterium]|nr:hypothetical protein [Gammaproteobacteria bacterium]
MIKRYALGISTAILMTGLSAGAAAAAEEAAEADFVFSEAETAMWQTDQLVAVKEPMRLSYRFEKSGTLEPGFTDSVVFDVTKVLDNGMKSATVQFFTGERNMQVPPVEETDVNPVIKLYMQGDVYEMNRLTDTTGSARERWRYFQRRIKFALAEGAEVTPTTIEFNGKQFNGKQISFTPYTNDPNRDKFEEFANKRYVVQV